MSREHEERVPLSCRRDFLNRQVGDVGDDGARAILITIRSISAFRRFARFPLSLCGTRDILLATNRVFFARYRSHGPFDDDELPITRWCLERRRISSRRREREREAEGEETKGKSCLLTRADRISLVTTFGLFVRLELVRQRLNRQFHPQRSTSLKARKSLTSKYFIKHFVHFTYILRNRIQRSLHTAKLSLSATSGLIALCLSIT